MALVFPLRHQPSCSGPLGKKDRKSALALSGARIYRENWPSLRATWMPYTLAFCASKIALLDRIPSKPPTLRSSIGSDFTRWLPCAQFCTHPECFLLLVGNLALNTVHIIRSRQRFLSAQLLSFTYYDQCSIRSFSFPNNKHLAYSMTTNTQADWSFPCASPLHKMFSLRSA